MTLPIRDRPRCGGGGGGHGWRRREERGEVSLLIPTWSLYGQAKPFLIDLCGGGQGGRFDFSLGRIGRTSRISHRVVSISHHIASHLIARLPFRVARSLRRRSASHDFNERGYLRTKTDAYPQTMLKFFNFNVKDESVCPSPVNSVWTCFFLNSILNALSENHVGVSPFNMVGDLKFHLSCLWLLLSTQQCCRHRGKERHPVQG